MLSFLSLRVHSGYFDLALDRLYKAAVRHFVVHIVQVLGKTLLESLAVLVAERFLLSLFLVGESVFTVLYSDSVDVFVSTGLCLEVKDDAEQISGFELMDIDGEWHSAAAVLSDKELWNAGEGTEILHVTGVEYPCGVRYLWTNYTEDIPLRDGENEVPMPPFIFTTRCGALPAQPFPRR